MRWVWKKPKYWDIRIKKWFALFPVVINNEYRWLESVTVKQMYLLYWYNKEFIDDTIQNNSSK
jgi:hypothetical protein